jgi:restriction system protein
VAVNELGRTTVAAEQDVLVDVPRFHELIRPALAVLADGREHHARDIVDNVATELALDQAQRTQTIPSGQRRLDNRVLWALSYLGQARAVERPKRGVYRVTGRGMTLLRDRPAAISVQDLRAFEEFREFQARSRTVAGTSATLVEEATPEEQTPLEQLSIAAARLKASIASDLVEKIRQQPPEFLEKAVLQLLVAMGYGGSDEAAQHLGGSGDGGFDGVINQDRLGIERIYVQAKRYAEDNTVGRPAVQAFVGALHHAGAAGGVLITTSRFSPEAVAFASSIHPRVILIDGPRLGQLMVTHRIGVQQRQVFHVVELDDDFFE